MAPSKKSKAPAKKPTPKKAPAQKVAVKSAVKPAAQAAAKQPSVAAYTPSFKPLPARSMSAQVANTLVFSSKVWWAFAWRQNLIALLFIILFSQLVFIIMVVGSYFFGTQLEIWKLRLESDLDWQLRLGLVMTLVSASLQVLAIWISTWLVVQRASKRKFKSFSLAHFSPQGTPLLTFAQQRPLIVGIWWRTLLCWAVTLSFFSIFQGGGEVDLLTIFTIMLVVSINTLASPITVSAALLYDVIPSSDIELVVKAFVLVFVVFFILINIAIIDRLITKRHFKRFSLVVEPRTDKQA